MAISLEFRLRFFFSPFDYTIKTQNIQLDGRERDEAAKKKNCYYFFFFSVCYLSFFCVLAIRQFKHTLYSLRVLRATTTAFKILLCLVQLLSDN